MAGPHMGLTPGGHRFPVVAGPAEIESWPWILKSQLSREHSLALGVIRRLIPPPGAAITAKVDNPVIGVTH